MENSQLVEQLSACKAAGMSPAAAAAAVMGDGRTSAMREFLARAPADEPAIASIAPTDLSVALKTAWSGLSASELAAILHTQFPDAPAIEIAQAVQSALPSTSRDDMYAALTGSGFSQNDAQGAVNLLYPVTVTVQSNRRGSRRASP